MYLFCSINITLVCLISTCLTENKVEVYLRHAHAEDFHRYFMATLDMVEHDESKVSFKY